jgi:hypothetical protein
MLLDGFNIQIFDDSGIPVSLRSLASVVKNQLIGIVGNSLVFPVAAGYKVSQSYITEKPEEGEEEATLFDHYKPLTPIQPYRISVPTKGVFLEAVQGACDACEKVKENSSQDWTKFTADEPTPFTPVTTPVPTVTDWKAAFKDFTSPIINIQNAPVAPQPGAGLAGLSELLGKPGIFKDVSGLEANQQNVIRTYLSNQENAKAFAEMAKGMAMQGHNTQNSDKIMDSLKAAKDSGAISKEDYGKLVKDHLQQQIDGGENKKTELEKPTKPTLTDAAVRAVDQGKDVKAQKIDKEGNTELVEISSGNKSDQVLAKVSGAVPKLKQENKKACWATVATMMMSWKKGSVLTVPEVLSHAGNKYLEKFNNSDGLSSSEKDEFISSLNMAGEAPANYSLQNYIDWLNTYGPLWITTDSSSATANFSPHARILTKITGTGSADGNGTNFTFNDPATGTEKSESFLDFINAFQQMAIDNKSNSLFIQIVHFSEKVSEGEGGGESSSIDVRRWPNEIVQQLDHFASTFATGSVPKIVVEYLKERMLNVWNGKGGIIGMMFGGDNAQLVNYIESGIPNSFSAVAAQAKVYAQSTFPGLTDSNYKADTVPFEIGGAFYCICRFLKESQPALSKNYMARMAHEICHYMLQSSNNPILIDTRQYLFHPEVTDKALGAKARVAFMNEVLGRRLNYLFHEAADVVDNPGICTHETLAKSCFEFATTNWNAFDYYKPITQVIVDTWSSDGQIVGDAKRRLQLGTWLQNFVTKEVLFNNVAFDARIKGEFNMAGDFLIKATDSQFTAVNPRGIQ